MPGPPLLLILLPLFVLPVGTYHLCPAIQPDLQATPAMAGKAIRLAVSVGY